MLFLSQKVRQEGGTVRYLTATENDRPAWFFVRLFPERYLDYKKALEDDAVSLLEIGEILACGWGKDAPADVKFFMRRRHYVAC